MTMTKTKRGDLCMTDMEYERLKPFLMPFTVSSIIDMVLGDPGRCEDCPLYKRCPMLKEISEHHESLDWLTYKNSCDDVIEQYVTTDEIVDRRNEEEGEKNSGR